MHNQFDHRKEEDATYEAQHGRPGNGALNFNLGRKGNGHNLSCNTITLTSGKEKAAEGCDQQESDADATEEEIQERICQQETREENTCDGAHNQEGDSDSAPRRSSHARRQRVNSDDKQGASTDGSGGSQHNTEPMVSCFSECLFISLIHRMTGNANVVDCFMEWKKAENVNDGGSPHINTPIADRDSAMEWIKWLCIHRRGHDKPVGEAKTKQHRLNTLIARTVGTLGLDILEIVPAFNTTDSDNKSPMHGAIPALFRQWAKSGEPKRSSLVTLIARCISNGVGLQMEDSAFFLGHQIVADFESYLPGIAGEVTLDSVHFGHGGREGIDIIHFGDETFDKNKTSPSQRKKRLQKLHNTMVKCFLKNACKEELDAMGLMKMNCDVHASEMEKEGSTWTHTIWKHLAGEPCEDCFPPGVKTKSNSEMKTRHARVWIGSLRCFELTDTEHFLCKLYLICIHSGASRALSNNPFCGSPFTHPRKPVLLKKDWDHDCKSIGEVKWNAFCKLREETRRYSHHLTNSKVRHVTEKELEESLGKLEKEMEQQRNQQSLLESSQQNSHKKATDHSSANRQMSLKEMLSHVASSGLDEDDASDNDDDDDMEPDKKATEDFRPEEDMGCNNAVETMETFNLEECMEGEHSQIDGADKNLPPMEPLLQKHHI